MVFIPPPRNIPQAIAYLFVDLSDEELGEFKKTWELASSARFNPMLELKIVRAPEDYHGRSHEYMRIKESEEGREDPFVIIDERVRDGAIWYVDRFATQDEVDDEEVESTSVLWHILIKIEALPISYVNWDIANMTLPEALGECDVEFPLKEGYEQTEIYGLDEDGNEAYFTEVWVTAEPGEYETSTDEEPRKAFMPMPPKVARLKEEVAVAAGLINRWTIPSDARPVEMPDGSEKKFPEGSVVLQLSYDLDFQWPPYKWPEGSL